MGRKQGWICAALAQYIDKNYKYSKTSAVTDKINGVAR
jgi:hypothetical protein